MCASRAPGRPLPATGPFFPGVADHVLCTDAERETVEALERLLARVAPRQVDPGSGTTHRAGDGALRLGVHHRGGCVRLTVEVRGDGTAVRWTGGRVEGRWCAEVERLVEALLCGRNELAMTLRLGHVVAVDTTVWNGPGAPRRLVSRRDTDGVLPALLRRLPGVPDVVERMSVSFDRDEALGPPVSHV